VELPKLKLVYGCLLVYLPQSKNEPVTVAKTAGLSQYNGN